MTVDLRALINDVRIQRPDGSSELNVTDQLESIIISNAHDRRSGVWPTTAKLTLLAGDFAGGTSYAESFNPLRNLQRWAPKNKVIIRTQNEAGETIIHPRGAFRILKMPEVPDRQNGQSPKLVLELGCLLELGSKFKPPGDDSGVDLGSVTTRTEIINRLAAIVGIGELQDPIDEYPLDVPLPRFSGSVVSQMGQIAYGAGYVLWIDNLEQLRATPYPGRLPPRSLKIVIGRDEHIYKPIKPSQYPADKIRAVGTRRVAEPVLDPQPAYQRASTDEYSTALSAVTTWTGTGTPAPTTYKRVREPKGLLLPDFFPGSQSLATSQEEYATDYYRSSGDKLLDHRDVRQYGLAGVVMPDLFPGSLDKILAKQTLIYPVYAGIQVRGIRTFIYEPIGKVYPSRTDVVNKTSRTLSSTQHTYWIKVGNGWTKITTSSARGDNSSGSTNSTVTDNSGGNQPPAPTSMPESSNIKEEQVEYVASFPEAAPFNEDEVQIRLDTVVDDGQLRIAAENAGRILNGRMFGRELGVDFTDEWLNWHPFFVVDVVTDEVDSGTSLRLVDRYVTEGEVFILDKQRAAVVADGIYWGNVRRRVVAGGTVATDATDDPADGEVDELLPIVDPTTNLGAPDPGAYVNEPEPDTPPELTIDAVPTGAGGYLLLFSVFEVVETDATTPSEDDLISVIAEFFTEGFEDQAELEVTTSFDLLPIGARVVVTEADAIALTSFYLLPISASAEGGQIAPELSALFDLLPISLKVQATQAQSTGSVQFDLLPIDFFAEARQVGIDLDAKFDLLPISVQAQGKQAQVTGSTQFDLLPISVAADAEQSGGSGGEYSIPTDLGLQLWYTSRSGITQDASDDITLIGDQYTTGRNGTPTVVKPRLLANELNGKPVIHFDTTGGVINFASTSSQDDWSVILIYKHEASPGGVFRVTNASGHGFEVNATSMTFKGSTGSIQSATLPFSATAGFAIYEWHVQDGECEFWQNGILIRTAVSAGAFAVDRLFGAGFSSLTGKLADLLVYNQRVEALNQSEFRSLWNSEYSIAIPGGENLPYSIPTELLINLKLWLHPQEGVVLSGSTYESERDYSGRSIIITPDTSSPSFVPSGLNGRGIVRTGIGGGDLVSEIYPTFNINSRAFTIIIVAKATGTQRQKGFIGSFTGPRLFSITTTETGTSWAFGGVRFSAYAEDTDWHIWEFVGNTSGVYWYRDGSLIYTGPILTSNTAAFDRLDGQTLDRTDVIVFDADIGDSSRANLRASLQSVYF